MEENGEVLSRIRGRGDEEITAKRRDQRVLVYKLFSCADHLDMVLMIVGTVSAVANGLSQPIMALLFGSAINTFNTSDSQHLVIHVSKLSLKLLYLAIGTSIAAFFQVWCWTVTGERQASRLRGLYLKAILRQEIGFFDTKTTTGDVVERMTECSLLIQDAMSEKVGRCIQLLSTFFGGFIVGFYKGMLLAFILLFGIPALAIIGLCVTIILSKISVRGQVVGSDAGNVVQETLHTIRMVASLSMEKQVSEKYKRKLEKAYGFTVQQGLVTGIGYGMVAFIVFCSYGLALWYGSKLIIEKGYTGGQVVSVLVAMVFGGMSLGQTSPSLNAITAGRAAAYKLFEAIERQPRIDPSDSNGIVLGDLNGELELRNVFFSYPARPDVPIFCGFSLRIPNGKTVALIGQNGSGKSTVISLLQRFYDPDAGEVLFDGIDLKKLRLRWVREKIGLVSQEPVFFAGTIRENLEYGKENATMEEIMEAIELANAAKFISELPQGLSTMVGERGIQLSGGQKQRIAIARVILKKPRVFLLDEATSALDVRSQTIVQGTLAKVMSNRTTLIIAHRLETINKADTIAFLHRGKLVKQGTHAELIKDTDGLYFQLVHSEDGAKNFENDGQMHMHDDESVHTGNKSQVSSKHSFSIHGSEIDGEERRERDEKNKEKCHRVIIKRLAKLHKPHLPILLLASIATSMHGLIFPIFGFLFSIAIKTFYEPPNKLEKDSKFWALMYMGLGIIDLVAMTLQNYLFGVAGAKLVQSIRSLSFQKVVHQEMCWFDEPANSSCAIAARISTNALVLQSISRDALALIVQNMATVIAGLLIALVASWRLALIFLALSSAVGLQSFIQPKFLKRFTTNENTMYEEACQVASDAVSNIRTIASFCAESKVMDLYQQKCNNHVRRKTWIGFIRGTGFGFSFFAFYFTNALCFYIGAILVQSRKATTEEVFKVYLALMVSAIGMSEASGIASDTSKAIDCVVSIFNILDSKPKIDSSSSEGMEPANAAGDIEFQNVNFGYPSRPSIKIFNGLCLSIPSGTTVALVGESGSGKSTVISLLQRFYDPYSGHITMGGIDIRKLKLCWLRLQMGLVSQEPILFNETIRANVAYGRQGDATEDEIIAATKAANAHDFISALPQGYDTTVGECGAQLSGGQKQRLAIARAIVRDPKILLLDEATSALDKGCERVVQEALDRVSAGRTTMVITHRLATIRDVDMIAVIKNGMVFEKGRHDELVSMPHGAYAALFETSSA